MRSWLATAALLALTACGFSDEDLDGDGFSVDEGDCDDLDPDVFPGADDVVGDELDQDCDGHLPVVAARGDGHQCFIDTLGAVFCAGDNSFGQLEGPVGTFTQIVAGAHHTCALDADGWVVCWGDDRMGQASPPINRGPYEIIGAGPDFSWGLEVAGRDLICWGNCRDRR